eukprot:gnl/TRDRNA2_/TRDRNA2_173358_c1_seq4.p1 gnl/TRDRNA2_/TRDRNA2_173358_c1~~gnl/TRDRNA2_/TRDRNA2_173358_c1_seq4.p1  ORF type:complete len:144 (-),score=5.52 gnl/TRDRNA2_/TRDRNA2_173358_c1_seq4:6-437(-)
MHLINIIALASRAFSLAVAVDSQQCEAQPKWWSAMGIGDEEPLCLLQTRMKITRARHDEGPCKSWCQSHHNPWSQKCKFKNCVGCSECIGTTPALPLPASRPPLPQRSPDYMTKVEFSSRVTGEGRWISMKRGDIDKTAGGHR